MQLQQEIKIFLYRKLSQVRDYKAGVKACCPFHQEDTPSFFVYYTEKMDNWFYKCHGCNKSGSLHALMRRLEGPVELTIKPQYTIKQLDEEQFNVYKPDTTQGLPDIFDYYRYRGISEMVARSFGFKTILGQTPACVMPVRFLHRYVGSVRRYLDPSIKYRYELEAECDFSSALWAYDAIDPTEPTIIVEGIIDAAVAWSHGRQAVALVTGKKWEPKLDYLKLLAKPICLPDNGDANSLDAFLEMTKIIGGKLAMLPPNQKDLSSFAMSPSGDLSGWFLSL